MKKTLFSLLIIASVLIVGCNRNPVVPDDMFCFTALEDGLEVSMQVFDETKPHPTPSLLYSLDGKNWQDFIVDQTIVTLPKAGDKVYIKANEVNTAFACNADTTVSYTHNYNHFTLSKTAKVSGNIMYLLNGEHPDDATMDDNAFTLLFYNDSLLMDAEELLLPAMQLSNGCYFAMFGKTSIKTAPALPATSMADFCYSAMFLNCKELTTAPALPATTLAPFCYKQMFYKCSALRLPPELPAGELADDCYESMFKYCTSLAQAPQLAATQLKAYCYCTMFYGCTSLCSTPDIAATTVANNSCQGMFFGCTSLVNGPVLRAATLAPNCYDRMFKNCTSLTHFTCLATDLSAEDCVTNWMVNVTTNGTLTAAPGTDWTGKIPETWTVVEN